MNTKKRRGSQKSVNLETADEGGSDQAPVLGNGGLVGAAGALTTGVVAGGTGNRPGVGVVAGVTGTLVSVGGFVDGSTWITGAAGAVLRSARL